MPPINGDAGNNTLVGTEGADDIFGFGGDDSLSGLGGADRLDGGTGADTMAGGSGDDRYIVDDAGDVVTEQAGQGDFDAVHTTLAAYTLTANVEQLRFTGSGTFTGTGNALNNDMEGGAGNDTLFGLDGSDFLRGGTGADSMVGGGDNDTYVVDDAGDIVVEALNEGSFDFVQTTLSSYTLTANVEALLSTGADPFTGTGNAIDNYLYGGQGNDTLFGLEGNDQLTGGGGINRLVGGAGNDFYTISSLNDVIVELENEGTDSVNIDVAATSEIT